MRMLRVYLTMRTEGITSFSNRYGVVVWTGENDTKTISVDANLFENGAKQIGVDRALNSLILKTRDLRRTSVNTTDSQNTPGKNHL